MFSLKFHDKRFGIQHVCIDSIEMTKKQPKQKQKCYSFVHEPFRKPSYLFNGRFIDNFIICKRLSLRNCTKFDHFLKLDSLGCVFFIKNSF